MVLKEKLQHLENGELTVNDKHQLLDKTYTSVEVKRGRGGQLYVQFTTSEGLINYFPNGKYGPFIARNTD
jgi:Holliday junction resolvase